MPPTPRTRCRPCDLVVDAAYGTGFRGTWPAPATTAPVLAVDIPSGVDGLTGAVDGPVLRADPHRHLRRPQAGPAPGPRRRLRRSGRGGRHRPGCVRGPHAPRRSRRRRRLAPPTGHRRPQVAGRGPAGRRLTRDDRRRPPGIGGRLPRRRRLRHPLQPGRRRRSDGPHRGREPAPPGGAVGRGRAGGRRPVRRARRSAPASAPDPRRPRRSGRWWLRGPGRSSSTATGSPRWATTVAEVTGPRSTPAVLTPHEGEFRRLAGGPPEADRVAAVRDLAAATGAVVLLKGPATVVAAPDGEVLVTTTGDDRLATAGTGRCPDRGGRRPVGGGARSSPCRGHRCLPPRPGRGRRLAPRPGRQ